MFKNMGGNIPGGNFLGGNFPGGNFPGGSLMGGNFPGGSFPDTILSDHSRIQHFYVTLHEVYNFALIWYNHFSSCRVVCKPLFLRNRNRFYLNSRSYSEVNSVCLNK